MSEKPTLSIVTPTLGNFSKYWLQQLLLIEGNVEFILVYPPNVAASTIEEPRVRILYSLYIGEAPQRATGLLNASGQYVIALDDDDFLHPHVLKLIVDYFDRFPQSWMLRLYKESIDYLDTEKIQRPWSELMDIHQLNVSQKREDKNTDLTEVPIAPLDNPFNIGVALSFSKRKDMHGRHTEPFNNIAWKTDRVKEALIELFQNTRFAELLTWLPSWGFDRTLGLFIQAKSFQKGIYIGHWMPAPGQVRYIARPYSVKTMKTTRLLCLCEGLVARSFPQYGYLWNLFFEEFYNGIKMKIQRLLIRTPFAFKSEEK